MTSRHTLPDLQFDTADQNLFLIDDLRLRADALKHSVLPRLQAIMNICIARIHEVYGVDALADSHVMVSPNFRTRRGAELRVAYEWCSAGLNGRRGKGRWKNAKNPDGTERQIVPYVLGWSLSSNGLQLTFANMWCNGLAADSRQDVTAMFLTHASLIADLLNGTGWEFARFEDDGPFFEPMAIRLRRRLRDARTDFILESRLDKFPVKPADVERLIDAFLVMFPVYDLCIQHSKGEQPRIRALVDRLNAWILEEDRGIEAQESTSARSGRNAGRKPSVHAKAAAAARVRVMPALRWQVFQRDGWQCVACGRGAHHGAILHVDHIQPRSKGGTDDFANLQTLCDACNLGKSNRDATNLRKDPHCDPP